MMMRSIILGAAAAAMIAAVAHADTASTAVPYQLDTDSDLETGCFPPCMCPVLMQAPLKGTFTLIAAGFDGLYQHYDVVDVHWRLAGPNGPAHVTGGGRYKVGGEFAVQQQMTLDLAVDGDPVQRYESGLVRGGGLPALDVDVALHGFFCLDSVYRVRAHPSVAGVGLVAGDAQLRAVPNPFQDRTEIGFALPEEAPVFASVQDLAGRRIRTLAAGERHGAGAQILTWDGIRDDGARAGSGLYFVVLRAAGREVRGAVVKLRVQP
jgi:opacity protein-like surface antigen